MYSKEFLLERNQRVNAYVIETQAPTNPGDSGGPVIDERGQLAGVVCGYSPGHRLVSLNIDVREVRSFLQYHFRALGVPWVETSPELPSQPSKSNIDASNQSPAYWIGLLQGSKEQEVQLAHHKLTQMGIRAVPELRKATLSDDPKVRLAVATILGTIGQASVDASSDLARLLRDSEPSIRAAAAQSFGQIGKGAREYLVQLIQWRRPTKIRPRGRRQ